MTISHTSLASRCSLARWRDLLLLFVDMTRAKARISRDHFRVVSFCLLLLLLLLRLAVCVEPTTTTRAALRTRRPFSYFWGSFVPLLYFPKSSTSLPSGFPVVHHRLRGGLSSSLCSTKKTRRPTRNGAWCCSYTALLLCV